jgi:hypothetical protein
MLVMDSVGAVSCGGCGIMESGLRVRRGAEAGGRVRASLRSTAFEVWLRSGRVNGVEDEGQLSRMSWILMMVNRQQEDESKKECGKLNGCTFLNLRALATLKDEQSI